MKLEFQILTQATPDCPHAIMIIDDSPVDQRIHSKIIQHSQLFHTIINCFSTDNALDYLLKKTNQQPYIIPDLILLDIGMPEKNGFDFLIEFKKYFRFEFQKIKIFILSSTLDSCDISRANADDKVHAFLTKPLDIETFTSEVKQVLSY